MNANQNTGTRDVKHHPAVILKLSRSHSGRQSAQKWQTFALALALLLGAATAASAEAGKGGNDALVVALDRLFKRTDYHRVQVHPANPKLLLIARDRYKQYEGGVGLNARWCGPRLLRYGFGFNSASAKPLPDHGDYLVDVVTRNTWKIGKLPGGENIFDCTPNGKWLIYSKKENPGKIVVLGRYSLETGKKELFLRMNAPIDLTRREWAPDAGRNRAWSPDGNNIVYFQKRLAEPIHTGEPRWGVYWLGFERPWEISEVAWLADSASVLLQYPSDPKRNLSRSLLEIRQVVTNQSRLLKMDFERLSGIRVDSANRIYGTHSQLFPHVPGTPQEEKRSLYRCEIVDDSLSCQEAIAGNPDIVPGYQVSSDGKAIFFNGDSPYAQDRICIWRYDVPDRTKRCLWKQRYVYMALSLSPDDNHLAFGSYDLFDPDAKGQTSGLAVLRLTND